MLPQWREQLIQRNPANKEKIEREYQWMRIRTQTGEVLGAKLQTWIVNPSEHLADIQSYMHIVMADLDDLDKKPQKPRFVFQLLEHLFSRQPELLEKE